MPLLFSEDFQSISSSITRNVLDNTNISRITPGSKTRALIQAISSQVSKAYIDFDLNLARSFLPYADGKFLDYLGEMLGVYRLGGSRGQVTDRDTIVKFYVETGTFGDINGANDITIPTGTVISSGRATSGVLYRTTAGYVLPAGDSELYVSVESTRDGAATNVSEGTLIYHNFTNYIAASGLLVNNVGAIVNGLDTESDNNYRYRIANQALASQYANETSIRLAALSVPGVAEVTMFKHARGIGTFDLLVETINPTTPQNVLDTVTAAINRVEGYGSSSVVSGPELTGISMELEITWRNDTREENKEGIRTNIKNNVSDYINNLRVGEALIYNEVIERVLGTSQKILNVGTAKRALTNLRVYKTIKISTNKRVETLLGDYQPGARERVIVEASILDPILVTDK